MIDSQNIETAIERLDIGLFSPIESQTTTDDRTDLLAIQRAIRRKGNYVYLEIGSHLGGTIQPHLLDPLCTKIYSIDSRPTVVADVRGEKQNYPDNSTTRMMNLLTEISPEQIGKIQTFDAASSDVDPDSMALRPDLCFIDGEHTENAAVADFDFCIRLAAPDGTIVFHDSNLVYNAIRTILARLKLGETPHKAMKLGGSIFAIALGNSPVIDDKFVVSSQENLAWFFFKSAVLLRHRRHRIQKQNRLEKT